jgi:hypothetical protein
MAKKNSSPSYATSSRRSARRPIRRGELLPALTTIGQHFAAFCDPDYVPEPLAQDEIGFMYIYAACGDKRLALELAFGLDVSTWSASQVYVRAQPILIRADLCSGGDWKAAMRRHELSLDDLAAHLKRLMTCGNPHAEVNALKLALMTGGLLERGDHAPGPQSPGATFHFHLATPATPAADAPRNVTPSHHRPAQPFLIEPEA